MNEVRHIHLGRQAYTIAADAYKELHEYLQAIKREAGSDVAEEVELRIVELLSSRGVTADKVVLSADVAFVMEQLGTPDDFSEKGDESAQPVNAEKRLFRDTDNAIIAGVAAGLGKYLGIDATIIRLLFIALVFFGGSGILLYVILWLLVPPARTKSERLQMEGLPVNVDNIKEVVRRADVEGVARRAGTLASRGLTRLMQIVLGVIGVGVVATGVMTIFSAVFALVVGLVRGLQIGGTTMFPVGAEQVTILACAVTVVALIGAMMAVVGVTLVRRRWIMPGWVLAAVLAAFLLAGSIGGGLAADSVPRWQQQYHDVVHNRHVTIKPFTRLNFQGSNVFYISQPGPTADVEIKTLGTVDTHAIKVTEQDGTLTVDTTRFNPKTGCDFFCPYGVTNTEIIITTPDLDRSQTTPTEMPTTPVKPAMQESVYGTGGNW